MQRRMRLVLLLILGLFVFQHGSGAMPDTSASSASKEPVFHIGKSFAHGAKLGKDNYVIWLAGVITILMSCASYSGVTEVLAIVTEFRKCCGKTLEDIDKQIRGMLVVRSLAEDKPRTEEGSKYCLANQTLFQILYGTIDESLIALKRTGAGKMFMDGLAFLKAAYDKHGPGSGAKQPWSQTALLHSVTDGRKTIGARNT